MRGHVTAAVKMACGWRPRSPSQFAVTVACIIADQDASNDFSIREVLDPRDGIRWVWIATVDSLGAELKRTVRDVARRNHVEVGFARAKW